MHIVTVQGIDESNETLYAVAESYSEAYKSVFDDSNHAGVPTPIVSDETGDMFAEKITFHEDNGCIIRIYCSEPF